MNGKKHYKLLLLMAVLHFAAMYALMYAMVDSFANVFANWNQFYMAAIMTSPMIFIEVWLMRSMYTDKRWNILISTASVAVLGVFFLFIRHQTAIDDKQFLRSMIPHHAGAILMCGEAKIEDAEIRELCESITEGQQTEIEQMKAILGRLEASNSTQ